VIVGVRHARVWNPDGVVYARLPSFHLSDQGRSDAGVLAAALSSAPLAAVFASSLDRAVETAEILAVPHGIEVQTDERLTEWSFWIRWQGMPWSRIRERDPDLLTAYAEDPDLVTPPLEEAGRLVLAWAAEAEDRYPSGLVLGVTHEAPLATAMLLGAGRSIRDYHTVNLAHLATVRLRPGPAQPVDLVEWARSC
jgi:broad specificity phosphatase PhoE